MSNNNVQQQCISPKFPNSIKFKLRVSSNFSSNTGFQQKVKSNCNIIPKSGKPFWIEKNHKQNRLVSQPTQMTSRLNEMSGSSFDGISVKQINITNKQQEQDDSFNLGEQIQKFQSLAQTLRDQIGVKNQGVKKKVQQMQETKKLILNNSIRLKSFRRHQSVVSNKLSFPRQKKVCLSSKTKNLENLNKSETRIPPLYNYQKIIDVIQFLRQNIPILQQNKKTIQLQQAHIQELKNRRNTSLDVDIQFNLDKKITQTSQLCSKLTNAIKLLKIKFKKKSLAYYDHDNVSFRYLQVYKRVRQNLFYKKKQAQANQNRQKQLDEKISMYEKLSKNCQERIKNLSIDSMERRSIFLAWDIERLKAEMAAAQAFQSMQICLLNNQLCQVEIEILKIVRMKKEYIESKIEQ